MVLKYQAETTDFQEVESKLKSLTLAYSKEKVDGPHPLLLLDSKENIIGMQAILAHLEDLEKELNSWYYCDC